MARSEALKRAQKNYYEKNKERYHLNSSFQNAKAFIRKTNDTNKLYELQLLVSNRIEDLKKGDTE